MADPDNKIKVVVTAINGEDIVLETVPDKNIVYWPLKNIPQPLNIGSQLTLELRQDQLQQDKKDKRGPLYSEEVSEKEALMRKNLEELVN